MSGRESLCSHLGASIEYHRTAPLSTVRFQERNKFEFVSIVKAVDLYTVSVQLPRLCVQASILNIRAAPTDRFDDRY